MSTPSSTEPCEQGCLCFYSESDFVGSIERYCPDDGIEPGCMDLKLEGANSAHNFTDNELRCLRCAVAKPPQEADNSLFRHIIP
jgi:hypothetical protein